MLNEEQLQGFHEWQQAGRRVVKIEIGAVVNNDHISVFVYDYDLHEGQFVQDAAEIDLVSIRKRELQRNIDELTALQQKEYTADVENREGQERLNDELNGAVA